MAIITNLLETCSTNNGDDSFNEIGRWAGIEASDWSWGALFFDMDNDGSKTFLSQMEFIKT